MSSGKVVAIHIAPEEGAPTEAVSDATIVPGKGIEGDRVFRKAEAGKPPKPHQEVTLIESEALVALQRDYGIALSGGESRRNILTEGVALNHLVGREFQVGECRLRGLELCEPCGYLEGLTVKGVVKGLLHRGGLRAQAISGGTVRPGDAIQDGG